MVGGCGWMVGGGWVWMDGWWVGVNGWMVGGWWLGGWVWMDGCGWLRPSKAFRAKAPARLTDPDLVGVVAVQNQSQRLDADSKPQALQPVSLFITKRQRSSVS